MAMRSPTKIKLQWQIEKEDPLAEVEAIEIKRGKGKKAKYLVKWVGSDKKTWEPLSHLKGAKEAVETYEAKFGRQSAKDKAKGKTIANVPVSNVTFILPLTLPLTLTLTLTLTLPLTLTPIRLWRGLRLRDRLR